MALSAGAAKAPTNRLEKIMTLNEENRMEIVRSLKLFLMQIYNQIGTKDDREGAAYT